MDISSEPFFTEAATPCTGGVFAQDTTLLPRSSSCLRRWGQNNARTNNGCEGTRYPRHKLLTAGGVLCFCTMYDVPKQAKTTSCNLGTSTPGNRL